MIVPVGSKGGFVPKRLPAGGGREAVQAEGIECYRIFIRGLLDVTDNLAGGQVVPPARVVRHDGDDPYLVVAADKGTATFSDIANALADEYGFWLGDAFASGGSQGYDHKGMGITARGAGSRSSATSGRSASTARAPTSPPSGSATWAATCSGTACCSPATSGWWARSTTCTSSSIRDPDPEATFAERERLSRCRARPGTTSTAR